MSDLSTLVGGPLRSMRPVAARGRVARPPATLTSSLTVSLINYSPDYSFTIPASNWMQRGGTLPAVGDRCIVVFDDDGDAWVPAWDGAPTSLLTDGSVRNVHLAADAAIAEAKLALASDAPAATPSRRTLGTGAQQAAAGNDSRIVNAASSADLRRGLFSAHRAGALSLADNSVVVFDTDSSAGVAWDLSNWYDTTNGRFTPQLAGYYRLSTTVTAGSILAADMWWQIDLRRNGAAHRSSVSGYQRGAAAEVATTGSWIVQANGTTDYFQVVIRHGVGAATAILASSRFTHFQGELIAPS